MARQPALERAIFTISRTEDGWAVEHEGLLLDPSRNKDDVVASAARRARASHDGGRPAQVRLEGEWR